MKNKKVILSLLLAIILAGFILRFSNIENIPSGIYPDEAQNGIDAQEANATGRYNLFYENNNGREGLFINLQALSIKYLGNNTLALKFPSIIFGTLAILGVFLLSYELFQNYLAGLVSAYLIAFSYWSINFSRIGFRAIMVPFILTFAFYFIFRGLRTKKISDFIIAGLIYGLGIHTYISFRVSPLVLIFLFVSLIITRKNFLKKFWKHILIFNIAMFATATPMLLDFFVWNPQHYASRTSAISVLNPEINQGHILPIIAKTFFLSLQKYFLVGDFNMRHNYPPYALLNPIVGLALFAGFIHIFSNFFRSIYTHFKNNHRDEKLSIYVFLLSWFFTLLIPEFLAAEGNPHALRSIGTLPVVMIIATIPIMQIIKKYTTYKHSTKFFLGSLIIFSFLFIGINDPIKYFVFFAKNPKQHQSFEANLKEVSVYIKKLPQTEEKYIVTGSMQRLTIEYLNPNILNTFYKYPDEANSIMPTDLKNFTIIFTDPDWEKINSQRDRFPDISFEQYRNSFGDSFYTLKY